MNLGQDSCQPIYVKSAEKVAGFIMAIKTVAGRCETQAASQALLIKLHHLHISSRFFMLTTNYVQFLLIEIMVLTLIKLDHHLMLKLRTKQSDPLSSDMAVRTHDIPVKLIVHPQFYHCC